MKFKFIPIDEPLEAFPKCPLINNCNREDCVPPNRVYLYCKRRKKEMARLQPAMKRQNKPKEEAMKRFLLCTVVVALLILAGGIAWSGILTPKATREYRMSKVEATDGGLDAISKAVFSEGQARWGSLLPRGWGLVQHEFKNKIVPHEVKHIIIPRTWVRGSFLAAQSAGQNVSYLYLFGSRIEDQVNVEMHRVQRPFFRGLTKSGSVVMGQSLRRMNPAELQAITRVIGNEVTIITFN